MHARLAGSVRVRGRGSLAVAPLAQRAQRLRLALCKAVASLPGRQHCRVPAAQVNGQSFEPLYPFPCQTKAIAEALAMALAKDTEW